MKEIFTSIPKYSFCIKKKNKQTIYNIADQTVDKQAANFVLMNHS